MEYRVHIYAVVRIPTIVQAKSQLEAIMIAEQIDIHRITDGFVGYEVCDHIEWAEEITGFLVDEVGDEEYEKSKYYDISEIPS